MPRVCDITGKRTRFGNKVTRRGKAKAEGGVGKKTTGISRRTYKPNLQRIRIVLPDGGIRRLRVAARVIKKGEVKIPFKGQIIRKCSCFLFEGWIADSVGLGSAHSSKSVARPVNQQAAAHAYAHSCAYFGFDPSEAPDRPLDP